MKDAELVDDWKDVLSTLLREDGYLVFGHTRTYAVNEIVPDEYNTGIPFKITGETTREDAIRQFKRLIQLTGDGNGDLIAPPFTYKFYKTVVAD